MTELSEELRAYAAREPYNGVQGERVRRINALADRAQALEERSRRNVAEVLRLDEKLAKFRRFGSEVKGMRSWLKADPRTDVKDIVVQRLDELIAEVEG